MELKIIPHRLTVCKVADISAVDMNADFYFIGKTDEELSRQKILRKKRSNVMTGGEDFVFREYLIFH